MTKDSKTNSLYDQIIDQLARQNIKKGIKPILGIMAFVISLATILMVFGLKYEYTIQGTRKSVPEHQNEEFIQTASKKISIWKLLTDQSK